MSGQNAKIMKQNKIKEKQEEAKKLAKPDISEGSRYIAQSKNEGDVVNRLIEYQKKYDEKLQARIESIHSKVTFTIIYYYY